MAKIQFEGIDQYVAALKKLSDKTQETIGKSIYAGADVVADRIRQELNALPTGPGKYVKNGEKTNTITAAQKQGLQSGFGIATMRQEGTAYNVKVGFTGYNSQRTKSYPNGQPNSVIARSVCSGTSFRQKNDFVGRASRAAKAEAEKAMEKKLDETLKQIMG